MPKVALDVGTVLLLILPGFLAYRFSVFQRADPADRSVIWQVSEILEHSLYVHLLGFILAYTLHFVVIALGSTTHLPELLKHGPQRFLDDYFAEALRWYVGYAIYVIAASMIIGAYNVPARVSTGMVEVLRVFKQRRLLKWIPIPGDTYRQEPIWYHTFRAMSDESDDSPILFVKMKSSGDIYVGEIASYPIVPDIQAEKDFLIRKTRYYRHGNFDDELDLNSIDGIGAVLLNSRDVESIRVVYRRDADGDDQLPDAT